MTDTSGFNGFMSPGNSSGQWNALQFMVKQLMRGMATATIVKVMAVTNDGGVSPVGFVDIQPLVNLTDGAGVSVPHGTIYGCPYQRLQGGANAVILDPEVGDLGIAIFADRDISSVIANKAQANPGSRRRFNMSDGMYLGGVLNGTPTQWVRFSTAGIELHSPTQIKLEAPDVRISCETFALAATSSASITTPTLTINGDTVQNGNVHTTGNTQLDGSAIVAGGAVLESTLAVTGGASFDSTLIDGRTGKDLGGAHEHDHGTMTGTGHTGSVI